MGGRIVLKLILNMMEGVQWIDLAQVRDSWRTVMGNDYERSDSIKCR
jgi:hypothetical protein